MWHYTTCLKYAAQYDIIIVDVACALGQTADYPLLNLVLVALVDRVGFFRSTYKNVHELEYHLLVTVYYLK